MSSWFIGFFAISITDQLLPAQRDRDARRAKEQKAINRGGVDELDNKRNEVAPKNWPSQGIAPP